MEILIQVTKFIIRSKKYWLGPIFVLLIAFGGLLILVQGSSLAPFIYALF